MGSEDNCPGIGARGATYSDIRQVTMMGRDDNWNRVLVSDIACMILQDGNG